MFPKHGEIWLVNLDPNLYNPLHNGLQVGISMRHPNAMVLISLQIINRSSFS